MNPRLQTTIFSLSIFLFLSGCDPGWDLSGEVIVPAEEQQNFEQYPAQVLVHTKKTADLDLSTVQPDEMVFRVGVLCEPSDETLNLEWELSHIGCSIRTEVSAWMTPLPLDEDQTCEELRDWLEQEKDTGSPILVDVAGPSADEPQAFGYAFPDTVEANCSTSQDHIELRLN